MKNLRLLVLLLVLVTAFVSCKKDKDPAPPTKTELLTAKPWKIMTLTVSPQLPDSIFIKGGTGFVQDLLGFYATHNLACFNDNIRTFKTNNSFTFTQGATKCDTSGEQYASGTWSFSTDENSLALTFTGNTSGKDAAFDWSFPPSGNISNYTITTLTSTSLVYTYALGQYTFTETLSNQ